MKSLELRTVVAALLLAALVACDGRPRTPRDDLAARVNGTEISAEGLLEQPGNLPGLSDLLALEGVIDRELLVQQARARGIERDPAVQQEIEESRQRILARVFVERAASDERLTGDEIAAFYRAHPGLFAQRQLFRINELIVVSEPALVAELRTRVRDKAVAGRRIGDLAGWLQARQIPYRSIALFKASEQLPADVLRLIEPLAPGEATVIEQGETTHVVQLLQVLEAPLSLEEAQPAIEEMIDDARRAGRARALALDLRAKARIEYLGAFAAARERMGHGEPSRLPVAAPVGPPSVTGARQAASAPGSPAAPAGSAAREPALTRPL